MSRTITVTRPRILMGFMLNIILRLEDEERLLTNGAVVTFQVSDGEHVLSMEAENNPKITDLLPLTIPAGGEDVAVQLCVRNEGGRPLWYLELQ